jgi:superoxide dismutase, Fe-Mn family
MSIHGSGWVWLVVGPKSELKVLATYNSGSPFDIPDRQTKDPNTRANLDETGHRPIGVRPNRRHEYLILPLLGLNCWEHAYVMDYGVSTMGKQEYLSNWWRAINWHRVYKAGENLRHREGRQITA